MLEYLMQIHVKKNYLLNCPRLGECRVKKLARSWGNVLGDEGKQIEGNMTEETVDKNCEYLTPLLKLIPGCESVNNDNIVNG